MTAGGNFPEAGGPSRAGGGGGDPAGVPQGAVAPSQTMGRQVMREARRYETVDRVMSWPLVDNKLHGWYKTYSSIKQSDSVRVTLSVLETLLAAYCRLLLLPLVRLPVVRTPLKVVDHFSSKTVRLVEAAAPRLRDHKDPMSVDGELLVTLIFLPLSMCLTMAHKVLQNIARHLVSLFPPLKEAHRNYDQKGLIGQWMTLLLMVWLYLPLQFLSHPTETIQYFFGIPSRITWKVTGLEEILASFLKMARDFLKRNDSSVAQTLNNVGGSSLCLWLGGALGGWDLAPVNFVKSVWSGEKREELKTRPRVARQNARRQNSPPPVQPMEAGAGAN